MSSSCCSRGEGNEFFLKKTIFREYTKVINLLLLLLGTWLSLGKRERKTQARQQCIECTRKGEGGSSDGESHRKWNKLPSALLGQQSTACTNSNIYVRTVQTPFSYIYAKRRGWLGTDNNQTFFSLCVLSPFFFLS